MTADDTPSITLPATEMTQHAALLTELGDQFPLSSSLISEHRAAFFSRHGHVAPGYLASVLVDEVAFAACLRSLAGGTARPASWQAACAGPGADRPDRAGRRSRRAGPGFWSWRHLRAGK